MYMNVNFPLCTPTPVWSRKLGITQGHQTETSAALNSDKKQILFECFASRRGSCLASRWRCCIRVRRVCLSIYQGKCDACMTHTRHINWTSCLYQFPVPFANALKADSTNPKIKQFHQTTYKNAKGNRFVR